MFWMHKGFEHVWAIKNLIYDQATYAFTPITYYCKRQSNPISEIHITPESRQTEDNRKPDYQV